MKYSLLLKLLALLIISLGVCPDAYSQERRQKNEQFGSFGSGTITQSSSSKNKGQSHSASSKSSSSVDKNAGTSQAPNQSEPSRPRNRPETKEDNNESRQITGEDKASKGTAYYASVVKKNGWLVGVGKPLTQDQVRHLNCYFKLSQKNAAGNWRFVEAFDGYGDANSSHSIIPYLINPLSDYDNGANADWKKKLKEVCKWEFVADASGKTVLEERSLLSDSSIVLVFHPIEIGEREILGSYTDRWGYPANLRVGTDGGTDNCASAVRVVRDQRGFDVLIETLDANGFPEINKDGSYQIQKEYDDDGNQTMEASLNVIGERMIDSWGNCGWRAVYKNGNMESIYYFDANGQPISMVGMDGNADQVFGKRYEYDAFGRETSEIFVDDKGTPATNQYGVHRVDCTHNDHGQTTSWTYYDINGNKCPRSIGDPVARVKREYNDKGLIAISEYFDVNGNYVSSGAGYCKQVTDYDGSVVTSQVEYVPDEEGSGIHKSFEYTRDQMGNKTKVWYDYGLQRIDSVDLQGRETLVAWYDLEGNPRHWTDGYFKDITQYDDANNSLVETIVDSDGDSYFVEDYGFSSRKEFKDVVKKTKIKYQYAHSYLRRAYEMQFDDSFNNVIAQWDLTPYGERARVGWGNNLCYKTIADYSLNGEQRTVSGRNEFDEPAYTNALGDNEEVFYIYDVNNNRNYDIFGVEIPADSMASFIEQLPRVYCIEVTDTAVAYPLGLRNGDIIINYGDWTASSDLRSRMDEFYVEAILQANNYKGIALLRHHPDTKSSEIVTHMLPPGKTSDLGFYPHKIYYTQQEAERLYQTCAQFGISLNYAPSRADTTVLLLVPCKGSLASTQYYHLKKYENRDPGFLLYISEKYGSSGLDIWSLRRHSMSDYESNHMFNPRFSGNTTLCFTHDMTDLVTLTKDESGNGGMQIMPIKVSHDVFQRLLSCYAAHVDEIPDDMSLAEYRMENNPAITAKQLFGKWHTRFAMDEDNEIFVEITFDFDKKAEIVAGVDVVLSWVMSDGGFDLLCSSRPLWSLDGICLEFDFDITEPQIEVSRLNLPEDISEADKIEALEQIEKLKETLTENFHFGRFLDQRYFIITELTKNKMVVKNGSRVITFDRIK